MKSIAFQATFAAIAVMSAYPVSASTCCEALAMNSWTFGTMGQIIAIGGRATELGLDRDGAIKALETFCSSHPGVNLSTLIEFLEALKQNAMPEK